MIVYRIETPDGGGPYRGDRQVEGGLLFDLHKADGSFNPYKTHPLPIDDVKGWQRQAHYKFAFETMEALYAWFGPHASAALRERGYHIARYEVDEVTLLRGSRQVAYDASRAVLVGTDQITKTSDDPRQPRLTAAGGSAYNNAHEPRRLAHRSGDDQ